MNARERGLGPVAEPVRELAHGGAAVASADCATCIRQRVTYCIAGSLTSSVKRAANAERDIASSSASPATVHGRAGSRWMSASARPI